MLINSIHIIGTVIGLAGIGLTLYSLKEIDYVFWVMYGVIGAIPMIYVILKCINNREKFKQIYQDKPGLNQLIKEILLILLIGLIWIFIPIFVAFEVFWVLAFPGSEGIFLKAEKEIETNVIGAINAQPDSRQNHTSSEITPNSFLLAPVNKNYKA
jgi:hypothetical protein